MNAERFDGHTLNDTLEMGEPDHDGAREMLCGGGIVGWLTMADHPSAEANARLIAAAPDLLAVLVSVLSTRDKQRERTTSLRKQIKRLRNALMACAQTAGDDPFFNEGGEGYEALYGGEEE